MNINRVTLIKLLDLSIQRKNGKQRVCEWGIKTLETFMFPLSNILTIVINEISTIQAYILGYINRQLHGTKHNCKAPFGDVALVTMSDFD